LTETREARLAAGLSALGLALPTLIQGYPYAAPCEDLKVK